MAAAFRRFYRVRASIPGQADLVIFAEYPTPADLQRALAQLEARPRVVKVRAEAISEATFVRETGRA